MEVKRRAIIYVEWSSVLCAFWFDVFILNDLSHLTYFDLYLCMWCKPALLQPSKHWWSAFEVSSSETGQFAGLFCSLGLCQLSNGSASLTFMVKELWYVFGLCFRPFVKVLAVQNFFFFVHHQTPSRPTMFRRLVPSSFHSLSLRDILLNKKKKRQQHTV